ncbi:MAG: gamma-glutamylcyclotransferase family protein [Motiliproteus sp.]
MANKTGLLIIEFGIFTDTLTSKAATKMCPHAPHNNGIQSDATALLVRCVNLYGDNVKYFAYGSNMSLPRLKERVPSAERVGVFALAEHTLKFHKVNKKDGSGKCDAQFTGSPDDVVIGALFEISDNEKVALDKAEGLGYGYQDKTVQIRDEQGEMIEAVTYYATNIDPSLKPYSWYLFHVVYGAKETGVAASYLSTIESTKSIEDPDRNRDARERAIYS